MSNDNTIKGLRDIMFDTLRGVKDGSIDIDKAKAINDTAQTIINSAKVEVDFMKATGHAGAATGFIGGGNPESTKQITSTPTGTKVVEKDPVTGVTSTVHKMRP